MQEDTSQQTEVNAIEVLSFHHAELQKNYNGKNKISIVGALTVLYFPLYDQFGLYFDSWSYALLKRLPVIASSHDSITHHCYVLPAKKESYIVKIQSIYQSEAIQNLETILKHNSQFSYQYEQRSFDWFGGSEIEIGKLKFKEKIKKGFKRIMQWLSSNYLDSQRNNPNLEKVLDYESLKMSSLDCHSFAKTDIEDTIKRSEHIADFLDERREYAKLTLKEAELMSAIEEEKYLREKEREGWKIHRQNELLHIQKQAELENYLIRNQYLYQTQTNLDKSQRKMGQIDTVDRP